MTSHHPQYPPYQNPYHPPQSAGPPSGGWAPPPAGAPPVWWWYVGYCLLMALIYAAVFVGGVVMVAYAAKLDVGDPSSSESEPVIMGIVFMALGAPFALFYGAAPLLPKRKWAWVYGIVAIGIGLTSACTLVFSIPLLIFWLQPRTKQFFGMT